MEIRRSFNPTVCSTFILDQDAENFSQLGLQDLPRLFGLPVPLFDHAQEEKLSSYLQMEPLLIQFKMLPLTLCHTQLQRPLFSLDNPLSDTVKLLWCPWKSALLIPQLLSQHSAPAPQPPNDHWPVNTTQYMNHVYIVVHLWGRAHPHTAHYQILSLWISSFPSAEHYLNPLWISWVHSSACLGLLEIQLFPLLPNPQATMFWV